VPAHSSASVSNLHCRLAGAKLVFAPLGIEAHRLAVLVIKTPL
jgi:hypothetical protein